MLFGLFYLPYMFFFYPNGVCVIFPSLKVSEWRQGFKNDGALVWEDDNQDALTFARKYIEKHKN